MKQSGYWDEENAEYVRIELDDRDEMVEWMNY